MVRSMVIAGFLALSVNQGYAGSQSPQEQALPSGVTVSSAVDPKSGNLIALWMPLRSDFTDGKEDVLEAVPVMQKYAMYICWPNPQWDKNAAKHHVFLFYDNVRKKTYRAKTLKAFLAVLAQQPRNIKISLIDSCTVSRCFMGGKEWRRVKRVVRSRGMRWRGKDECDSDSMSTFCYCECGGGDFIYPGDKKAALAAQAKFRVQKMGM